MTEGRGGLVLTVEIHVPGVIAVLILPDGLADGANQRDGQEAAEKHEDLKVGDALHIGKLQRGACGVLEDTNHHGFSE